LISLSVATAVRLQVEQVEVIMIVALRARVPSIAFWI
jgi:hypothetical protein